MMPITPTEKIWMNGELVPWESAQVHILTHSLHYGTGVFEGIRAYETDRGPAVFRLTEHIERLFNSARIMLMEIPYTADELVSAVKETVRSTGLPSCYIRPLAIYGYGGMGLVTPPLAAGALPGITQDSVTTIAHDHGFEVSVDNLSRSDLYIAEEMFVCGTAAEVSAVNSVDDRVIPCPGPMTQVIAGEYGRAVRGEVDKYKEWCEHVG